MACVESIDKTKNVISNAIVARLAGKIVDFDKTNLTKQALAQAKSRILDTIGVTLAGVPEPCTQILLRTPGVATAPGLSLIVGTDRRTSALDATLVNAAASHALDLDGMPGRHHRVPIVSMLFALAEERKGRGDDLIAAYVIGIETETRLAPALDFHDDKGRHPAFTLGTFAAAGAASHFLKLDPERVAAALAIAASLANSITVDVGAMTKPLLVGQCARNGLLAALLAEQGLDAVANASADHQGFFHVFNGGARSTSNDCSPIGAHHSRSRPQRHVVRSSGTNSKIVPHGHCRASGLLRSSNAWRRSTRSWTSARRHGCCRPARSTSRGRRRSCLLRAASTNRRRRPGCLSGRSAATFRLAAWPVNRPDRPAPVSVIGPPLAQRGNRGGMPGRHP
jgi:hypothetical protein